MIGEVVLESTEADGWVGVITVTEPAIAVPDGAPVAVDADSTAESNEASATERFGAPGSGIGAAWRCVELRPGGEVPVLATDEAVARDEAAAADATVGSTTVAMREL